MGSVVIPSPLAGEGEDGGQHMENSEDMERAEWLESQGFYVLRFWNNHVLSDMECVTKVIWDAEVLRP